MSIGMGELAAIVTDTARDYRNGTLIEGVLQRLSGQPISDRVVREVLEPYRGLLQVKLPASLHVMLRERLDELVPHAMARVFKEGAGMNDAKGDRLTQDNADALLALYANIVGAAGDVCTRTRDLAAIPVDA